MLFMRDEKESLWFYRGQYRIRFESYLTPEQWASQSIEFKRDHTLFLLHNKQWAQKELGRLGLKVDFTSVRQAIERGDIKWEVKVIECIGFNVDLYSRLEAYQRALRL
jgi:hypothetical protein